MSTHSVEYSLKDILTDMKTDLQASQVAIKTDLQASQAAQEKQHEQSQAAMQAAMKSYFDAQSYKIIFSLSAIFVGSLAIFDAVGVYIHFPWRKLGRSSLPGP